MKVVILAGGYGTRISEESHLKPKPMIGIGERPIIWHIMKEYSHYGFNDFIICLGYKAFVIKEYFANYFIYNSDICFDLANNEMKVYSNFSEPWKVTLVDTGLNTMTGGRIKRIEKYVENETFMLTYGDGVSNIDINKLLEYHKQHGKIGTISSVNVGQKYGVIVADENNLVNSFREKNNEDGSWINAGYMIFEPKIFKYLKNGDKTIFEKEPLEELAKDGELVTYKHNGFWQCMDTQRDKQLLERLWLNGEAPWKVWEN